MANLFPGSATVLSVDQWIASLPARGSGSVAAFVARSRFAGLRLATIDFTPCHANLLENSKQKKLGVFGSAKFHWFSRINLKPSRLRKKPDLSSRTRVVCG